MYVYLLIRCPPCGATILILLTTGHQIKGEKGTINKMYVYVCVCVCACVRAPVRACACVLNRASVTLLGFLARAFSNLP